MTMLSKYDLTKVQACFLLALDTECSVILLTEILLTMASALL